MKIHTIICLAISVLGTSAFATAVEKDLIFGNHVSPTLMTNEGIAEQITAYAASANFHSGKMGRLNSTPVEVLSTFRDCIASGRYIVVRFKSPYFLSIVGNREVQRDLSISEIIVGLTDQWFPSTLQVVTGDCEVLTLSKYSGELGLQIQKSIAAGTKGEQGGTGQPATRPESKSEGGDKPQPEAEGRSR